MLINEVYLDALHLRPQIVEVATLRVRTRRTDNLNFGMLLAQALYELLQTYHILGAPLLVTHTEELHVERLGVTHLSTDLTIYCSSITISKLDKVDCILNIGIELINSHMSMFAIVLILTRETYIHYRERLSTNLLREQEVLIETETIGLEVVGEETITEGIVPTVLVQGTVLNGTKCILPVVTSSKVSTLYDTATGEAEATGLHISQCLHEVLTETTLAALPCVNGEE